MLDAALDVVEDHVLAGLEDRKACEAEVRLRGAEVGDR